MYRYIGNKAKLTPYILDKVHQMIGDAGTVADIMAGTGTVSLELRKKGYKVVASDVMTYSYHHLNVNLCMKEAPEFIGLKDVITDDLGCMYLTWLLYQQYAECGYTQSRTYAIDESRSVMHTYWTQKGRLFLYDLLKNEGILPVIEQED